MQYDVPKNLEENRCFCCGSLNPHGLHLEFELEGEELSCTFVADERFCGFEQVLHGGIQSAVLDEVAVWAVAAVKGRMGMTSRLDVRFLKPVRVGAALVASARILGEQDGRYTVEAFLRDEAGTVRTSAEVEVVPMTSAHFRRFTRQREVPAALKALIP